jgi:hypothetical protein
VLTSSHSGTSIDEVETGIYRINTPLRIDAIPGGFNLSQYLIVDDEPMVFHTGWRKWFPFVSERLALLNPTTLACQHGSAYRGDGAGLLRELTAILDRELQAELA